MTLLDFDKALDRLSDGFNAIIFVDYSNLSLCPVCLATSSSDGVSA